MHVPTLLLQSVTTTSVHGAGADADPLILGLLALAAAFIFSCVFWGRIDELSVLGLTIRLANDVAAATSDIRSRTPDDQAANRALTEFFTRFFDLAARHPDLGPEEVGQVRDRAIGSVLDDPASGMRVERTPDGLRVEVEHTSKLGIRITTAPLLIPDTFGVEVAEKINGANDRLGRRLAAIDTTALEVIAALSYRLGPGEAIVIEAIAATSDPAAAFAAQTCTAMLTECLHALARALAWRDAVFLRLDREPAEDQLEVIGAMGFRPATHAETTELPSGLYWRQDVT